MIGPSLLLAALGLLCMAPSPSIATVLQIDTLRRAFAPQPPACASTVTCIPVVVHIVFAEGQPVASPAWLRAQIEDANLLFAPISIGFGVAQWRIEPASNAVVETRADRDALGHRRSTPGTIDVYVVAQLADVDRPGEVIRGVHWRDRSGSGGRWIILSAIASRRVLAHELGHYFGLPHSRDGRSIMNKQTGEGRPPWLERTFTAQELTRMTVHRDRMLGDEHLVPWQLSRVRIP